MKGKECQGQQEFSKKYAEKYVQLWARGQKPTVDDGVYGGLAGGGGGILQRWSGTRRSNTAAAENLSLREL